MHRALRLFLVVTLFALTALAALPAAEATAATRHPCGPHSYPQPRTWVEAQGWWTDADGIDVTTASDSGHVHVGTCLTDDLRQPNRVSVLKVRLVLHQHTGRFDQLVVVAKGAGYTNQVARLRAEDLYLDAKMRQPHGSGPWVGDPDGTTVRWARVRIDATTAFEHSGRQQLRLRAFTRHEGEVFMASLSTPWQVHERHAGVPERDYTRENYLRGKGMYTDLSVKGTDQDRSYCDASLRLDHLGTQPAGWSPPVALVDHRTGNVDNPVTSHLVAVDRNEHAGEPGTVLRLDQGPLPAGAPSVAPSTNVPFETVAVPTTELGAGAHMLALRSNCLDVELSEPGRSQQSGVLVVGFQLD